MEAYDPIPDPLVGWGGDALSPFPSHRRLRPILGLRRGICSRAAVGMGIPVGIPMGMGMGWVWGLKSNPHGSPGMFTCVGWQVTLWHMASDTLSLMVMMLFQ